VQSPASVRNRLVAGTLVLFAARLILSLFRSGPVLVADEVGYLTNARVLAGGAAGQLHQAPLYRGGYSLLIAPLIAAGHDPALVYHLVLALNAALAASLFPLLYLLLTRYAGVASEIAIWAAFAGAVYPAITVLSQVAMSENALFPLICVWLIAWGGLIAARDLRTSLLSGAVIGLSTAALWAVHGRMIVAVALTAALLAWLGVRRRAHPATVLTALAVLGAGILAAHLLERFIIDHNYGGHASEEASDRLSGLIHGHGLRTVAANLLGQIWYLVVATFGLAALVVADVATRVRRLRSRESTAQPPAVVALLVALMALLLLVSAAAFPVRTRPDMLIYGRYAEVCAPPLIAIGLAILARRAAPQRALRQLLAFIILTGGVVVIRATASDPDAANRWNISALPFVTGQLGPPILIGAALVAAAGAWLLVRASVREPPALAAVASILFLAVVAYGVWNPVASSQRAVYPDGWTSPQAVAEAEGIRLVAYDLDHYDTIGLYTVQWFLPHTSVLLFHGDRQAPPVRYVLSTSSWPREHPALAARALWRARGRDEILWRLSKHSRA
jgi:hypothetical protein